MQKRSIAHQVVILVVFFLGVSGCSGDEDDFMLVGDWFFCETTECKVVTSAGIRFKSDNVWTELKAGGDYIEANEKYCAEPGEFKSGSYKLEGMKLKIKGRSCGSIIADGTIRIDGDAIVFVETQKAMKRIEPPRLEGPCKSVAPAPDAATQTPDMATDAESKGE